MESLYHESQNQQLKRKQDQEGKRKMSKPTFNILK